VQNGPQKFGTLTGMSAELDPSAALMTFLDIHDREAPGAIEGLYVTGSLALGDWQTGRSDIDVVAVLAEPPDSEVTGQLATAMAMTAEQILPLRLDGPYVSWGDLVVPSMAVSRPWTLDGVWHVDGDCFQLNPVTWRSVRRYAITARGPDPATIGIYDNDSDLREFLLGNLTGYWSDVRRELVGAIGEMTSAEATLPAEVIEWSILGVARIHITLESGEIVSKSAAGERLLDRLDGEQRNGVELALACRCGSMATVTRAEAVDAAAAMGLIIADALGM